MNSLQKSCALLCMLMSLFSFSQQSKSVYMFGHSLMVHEPPAIATPSNETTIPHWLHVLAAADGNTFLASGQYGFLQTHERNLPPISQWGFDHVTPAWNSDTQTFSEANFDAVLITPANFVQYQASDMPYYNDASTTPVSATATLINYINTEAPNAVTYIYENWPDMAGFIAGQSFPPSALEFADYNDYTLNGFHDWWLDYHDNVQAENPNKAVRMIPVGITMSKLFTQAPLNQIPILDLYEDNAPHGRPTTYFLAGLITYMAIYQKKAPVTYPIPNTVNTLVSNNFQTIVDFIWNELVNFNDASGNNRVFVNSVLSTTNLEPKYDIVLSPNPVGTSFVINNLNSGYYVECYNLNGIKVAINVDYFDNRVYTGNLSSGIYIIKIILEDAIVMKKIVKSKINSN